MVCAPPRVRAHRRGGAGEAKEEVVFRFHTSALDLRTLSSEEDDDGSRFVFGIRPPLSCRPSRHPPFLSSHSHTHTPLKMRVAPAVARPAPRAPAGRRVPPSAPRPLRRALAPPPPPSRALRPVTLVASAASASGAPGDSGARDVSRTLKPTPPRGARWAARTLGAALLLLGSLAVSLAAPKAAAAAKER